MKAIYKKLSPKPTLEEEANWGLVGLLHDADYELSRNHPEKHTLILEEKIGDKSTLCSGSLGDESQQALHSLGRDIHQQPFDDEKGF